MMDGPEGSPRRVDRPHDPVEHRADLDLSQVKPGGSRRVWLELLEGGLVAAPAVPVLAFRGKQPGPTVGVTAAVHGDEVNGTLAAHKLARAMAAGRLTAGTVVLVPVVNLPGMVRGVRGFVDGKDLNRSMTGSPDGRPSHRFASRLVERLVSQLDYLVDLHTATRDYNNCVYVRANLHNPACDQLARSLRLPVVVHKPAPEGSLRRVAELRGVPAAAIEIGNPACFQPLLAEQVCDGVLSSLAKLDMVPHAGSRRRFTELVCKSSHWVRAGAGGFLSALPEVGKCVAAGETIARIANVWGDPLEELVAPHDAVVIGTARRPVVSDGTRVVHLGTID